MLAFVGGRQWTHAWRLEDALAQMELASTRHGQTTREIGLPACRALLAFGEGDNELAIELLEQLPSRAYRLGGSHAQRDVLYLTLRTASRGAASSFRQRPSRSEAQSLRIH